MTPIVQKCRVIRLRIDLARMWLLFVVVLSFVLPIRAFAQEQTYDGMDLIVLVDQSHSMRFNDKNGLRFWGPQFIADWLGQSYLNQPLPRHIDFRYAVVYVDFDAQIVLPWEDIAPLDADSWERQRSEINKKLDPNNYGLKDLAHTDFLAAFRSANQLIDELGTESGAERLKVVLLITDGLPTQPALEAWRQGENPVFLAKHFADVLEEADLSRYKVHVRALNDQVPYWNRQIPTVEEALNSKPETVGSFFRKLDPSARLIENNTMLGADLHEILIDIAEELGITPDNEIGCGTFGVNPFVHRLDLTFYKSDPNDFPALIPPAADDEIVLDERSIEFSQRSSVHNVGLDTPIQSAILLNPIPGQWRVVCPEAISNVDSTRIFAREFFLRPNIRVSSDAYQALPVSIDIELIDPQGRQHPWTTYRDGASIAGITVDVLGDNPDRGSLLQTIAVDAEDEMAHRIYAVPFAVEPINIQSVIQYRSVDGRLRALDFSNVESLAPIPIEVYTALNDGGSVLPQEPIQLEVSLLAQGNDPISNIPLDVHIEHDVKSTRHTIEMLRGVEHISSPFTITPAFGGVYTVTDTIRGVITSTGSSEVISWTIYSGPIVRMTVGTPAWGKRLVNYAGLVAPYYTYYYPWSLMLAVLSFALIGVYARNSRRNQAQLDAFQPEYVFQLIRRVERVDENGHHFPSEDPLGDYLLPSKRVRKPTHEWTEFNEDVHTRLPFDMIIIRQEMGQARPAVVEVSVRATPESSGEQFFLVKNAAMSIAPYFPKEILLPDNYVLRIEQ